jgi:BirA family transcriptional regulator, biotin operon repressor / biotin---[acetyl-CoA-carboxylase] ligase
MVTAMSGDHARRALETSRFADLRWVESTGSTNADLLALAAEGAPDGVVLVADHQTAGRGRLGRTWEAPTGSSLLCSVLLRPDLAPAQLHLVSLATAVAASDACHAVAGVRPLLKWPNDLLIEVPGGDGGPEERKVAGILAESSLDAHRVRAVVVGMGLNVNWPVEMPDELAAIATSLNHHAGREIDREELLVAHLLGLEQILERLGNDEGREALLLRYRHLSCTLGRQVRVELGSGALTGHATDLTPDGHLLVELAGELVPVAAGDVVHLRATD